MILLPIRPVLHGMSMDLGLSDYRISKNPVVARFFHEIGRADELGSGVRNMMKCMAKVAGFWQDQGEKRINAWASP